MFIQRVNIFLLSFIIALAPASIYSSVYVPPFPSAAAAADIASALGVGIARGFSAAAVGSGVAAAAVGVGVGSFCLASAVQGADSCGAGSAICQALTVALIDCRPTPSAGFNHLPLAVSDTAQTSTWRWVVTLKGGQVVYYYDATVGCSAKAASYGYTLDYIGNLQPDNWLTCYMKNSSGQQATTQIKREINPAYDSNYPKPLGLPATPEEVGAAIAGNPAAAAAAGSAAKAYANALTAAAATGECAGAYGFVNGTETCVKEGLTAAEAAAAAAAANPPLERTCATGFTLDASTKLCSNDGLSKPNTCNAGMVANSSGVCVPADPLNPTQPATGTEKPLPAFCTYASVICDVIQWFKQTPEAPTNTNVTVTNKGIAGTALEGFDISQSRVNFGGSCPAPIDFSFSFMGSTQPLSFKFQPFCEFLSQIRPVIIACAYLGGAYIVAGAGRKGDA